VEQREDRVSPDNWSIGYLSFLIGALTLYWLQAALYDGPDIKKKQRSLSTTKSTPISQNCTPDFLKAGYLAQGLSPA